VSRSPAAPAILSRSFAVPAALLVAFLVLVAAAPNADAAKGGAKGPPARSPKPTTTITRLEGIDVSKWQGAINWSQVKSSGKQFALIRASAGSLTVDEWYASNRSSAKANGLKIGAYHYANPDSAANDALNEANFFLSLATPARGELIPTLDVEVTNGLSVAAMQAWVSTWLQRVTSVLGVRPMIYTSPSFWTTYLGDTTQFADAGYRLWIAHWGVDQPRIPASNWGGRGWTFWQYTSSGTVPGISGNVDLDRYNGSQLASSLFIP
jgi:GH25 family lysozyme M1 (1,4-beta-N-acetylmuramidase)